MRHLLVSLLFPLVCLFTLLSSPEAKGSDNTKNKVGPDFTLKSVQGNNIRLSEQRGRWVILYFWATWCSVCREDLMRLQAFKNELQYDGLQVFGVNLGQERVGDYASSAQIDFPLLLDPRSTTAEVFNVDEVPTAILVNRDGQIEERSKRVSAARLNELAKILRAAPDYR